MFKRSNRPIGMRSDTFCVGFFAFALCFSFSFSNSLFPTPTACDTSGMRTAVVLVAVAAVTLLCAPTASATLADASPARLRRHAAAQRRAALGCGDEGQALAQIYASLGGSAWWQRGGWLSGDHCNGWYGVTCQLGHVTYVRVWTRV